jgi:hypothetical protein
MVAHAIVMLACKQFVLLCFVYLVLYSFNITLSWSAIMLLDSVLINFIWNCIYVWMSLLFMYVYVYMTLCFMLLDSVLINCICNYIYIYMSLLLCMSMYAWVYASFMLLDSVLINFISNSVLCMHEFAFMYDYVYMSLCFILMSMHACFVLFFCFVMSCNMCL